MIFMGWYTGADIIPKFHTKLQPSIRICAIVAVAQFQESPTRAVRFRAAIRKRNTNGPEEVALVEIQLPIWIHSSHLQIVLVLTCQTERKTVDVRCKFIDALISRGKVAVATRLKFVQLSMIRRMTKTKIIFTLSLQLKFLSKVQIYPATVRLAPPTGQHESRLVRMKLT